MTAADDRKVDVPHSRKTFWLGVPFAVLASGLLQTNQLTCEKTGDTTLATLELIVDGTDRVAFDPGQRSYDVYAPGSPALLRAQATDPAARLSYNYRDAAQQIEGASLGVGGGEVLLDVPIGETTLTVYVKAPGGASDSYVLHLWEPRSFGCTAQGIRDAIAWGGGPHIFDCDGPTTVVTEGTIEVDKDVELDGLDLLSVGANGDHAVFVILPGVTAGLRRLQVVDGGLGIANQGDLLAERVTVRSHVGAGISNKGSAVLTQVVVADNASTGIYNDGILEVIGGSVSGNARGIDNTLYGTASLARVTISGNGSTSLGGGIISRNWASTYIEDCTISDNQASFGGGLYNLGETHVVRSTFSRNSASKSGGGIYNIGGAAMLLLEETSVVGNYAVAYGGGVMSYDYATLEIADSDVSGNTAGFSGEPIYAAGGGIYSVYSSVLTVRRSTISGNAAESGGGGIRVGDGGTMLLESSTVSGNQAAGGGGISLQAWVQVTSYIVNSTISGNSAVSSGGGITNNGTLEILSSTIAGNVTEAQGSAIYNSELGGTPFVRLRGSLVEGDCASSRFAPPPTSGGYNIESPGDSCELILPSDKPSTSPEDLALGPLEDNGGPTETHALLAVSVAIDQVPAEDCVDAEGTLLTTDQRGFPRGSKCDVGAFEVQP